MTIRPSSTIQRNPGSAGRHFSQSSFWMWMRTNYEKIPRGGMMLSPASVCVCHVNLLKLIIHGQDISPGALLDRYAAKGRGGEGRGGEGGVGTE
ncbi:hypothetical protein D9757_012857 [Collybiopsis confluens]|uniref:Uncharacterized protein n=1 Tax=Collybiopsis confluens TaxID=2823264 RepID=A0A8H5G1L1_9AGAR|nr:hypothetical protein D9757_012857 [Collybiopsis confluens]